MRYFLLTVLLFFSVFPLAAQPADYLLRFSEGTRSGYRNLRNDTVIPAGTYETCYTDTFRVYAVVKLNGELIAIDRKQKKLYDVLSAYGQPDRPENSLFRIKVDGKTGYADVKTGTIRIAPQFARANPFDYGSAIVCDSCVTDREFISPWDSNSGWYYIDTAGNRIITYKGKKYDKAVIDARVKELDALKKGGKLKKVPYFQKSRCGESLTGYYFKGKLEYIHNNALGDIGFMEQSVYFKDSSVVKIVITSSVADFDAYELKYPKKRSVDPKLLTYIKTVTTIRLTDPVEIKTTTTGKEPAEFTEEDLEQEMRCIEILMMELYGVPYFEAEN